MLGKNVRFHNFSNEDLFRYIDMVDRAANAIYYRWRGERKNAQLRQVGLMYRAEYWAGIHELSARYEMEEKVICYPVNSI